MTKMSQGDGVNDMSQVIREGSPPEAAKDAEGSKTAGSADGDRPQPGALDAEVNDKTPEGDLTAVNNVTNGQENENADVKNELDSNVSDKDVHEKQQIETNNNEENGNGNNENNNQGGEQTEVPFNVNVQIKDKDSNETADQKSVKSSERIEVTKENITNQIDTDKKINDEKSGQINAEILQRKDQTETKGSKKETMKQEKTSAHPKPKKMKKGIFVSYSPDAGFIERKFIVETIKQLKENNLAEDIWFDKDEKNTDSPCWFSFRMEAVERCKAAILFLSDSYFSCPVSVYEGKALLERQKVDPNSVKVFVVLYSLGEDTDVPKHYNHLMTSMVDLTGQQEKKSIAEKTSYVVGSLMDDLDKYASINAAPRPATPPDTEFTGGFKKKKICQWSPNDLQEWTFNLGIKEFYRQSLAENMVDGFLLMSMTDQDMIHQLGIDSRVVRKKLMQQILVTLDKEHKLPDNWHLRARTMRTKVNCIYLIYDPADVRLAQNLKHDLIKKNLQVIHHQKLGQSKEEFLQLNGSNMATATYVLVLLTDAAATSPFVFHEVLFADWLGKKILTAMFKNTWKSLRTSMKAVLGECPSVDFESKLYLDSMDVLEHHIKPLRAVPGVVLEQAYLNKMADGLKPLEQLASPAATNTDWIKEDQDAKVFISYQWDMQSRVEDIRRLLEANSLSCWTDITPTLTQRGHSSMSSRSTHSLTHAIDPNAETLQSQIQRTMKASAVVLCCITPKYMQSDNCVKDLTLAELLHKPIMPLMMRFCPWPPEGTPSQVRKILAKHPPLDLSNDKLFRQNVPILLDKIRKIVTTKPSA